MLRVTPHGQACSVAGREDSETPGPGEVMTGVTRRRRGAGAGRHPAASGSRLQGGSRLQDGSGLQGGSRPPGGTPPRAGSRPPGGLMVGGALRQAVRKAEGGEQAGIDEVVIPDDPAAGDLDDLDRPRPVPALLVSPIRAERGAAVGRGRHQA
jgi:hypothetical protein